MEEFHLNSWSELQDHLTKIEQAHQERKANRPPSSGSISPLLFRGQSNAKWPLSTTLERCDRQIDSVLKYIRTASSAQRFLSGFNSKIQTTEPFRQPSMDELKRGDIPNYGFLAYLRHHGFPSPLLDWSESPYVALFFAFRNASLAGADRVALFYFQEYLGEGKSMVEPFIRVLGPWTSAHPRHHLQQCNYTLCVDSDGDGNPIFANHEEIMTRKEDPARRQDRLVKLTLPTSEAATARRNLSRFNVTPYSLFQSEDSLIETVADRLF